MFDSSGISVMFMWLLVAAPAGAAEAPSSDAAAAVTTTSTPDSAPTLVPAPAPAPTATPTESPPPADATWLDTSHGLLSQGLFWPVNRFDRFFADEREVDAPRARSFIRWRNDFRTGTDSRFRYQVSGRADLRFPKLSRRLERLRLTLVSETRDAIDPFLVGDQAAPAASGQVSAGLGFDLLQTLRSQSDLQAGILFELPVGAFARARLRHVAPVSDLFQIRTSSSGFWQTNTGWGVRQAVDLERPFGSILLLRLANDATLTERSRGLEWVSELSVSRAFGTRAAVALLGSASGAGDAGAVVEKWRVATRLRRDAFRRWIFLDLEPEGTWTRPVGGGRKRVLALTFRLEVQFDAGSQRPP